MRAAAPSDQSALQSQLQDPYLRVWSRPCHLNLKDFRLAGARAEKTIFNESVFYQMELTNLNAPHAEFKNANFVGQT